MDISAKCLECDTELVFEVEVDSYGEPASGMSGPYEFSHPGSGPEYHVVEAVRCEECDFLNTESALEAKYADTIVERINDQEPRERDYDDH